MRHISIVVPLLLAFSSEGYGGPLGKLFCPTICNPNPKEPLRTCFYKCGFLRYGKYFDGSRCWYLVGTGKIINAKGYCNQGMCLKVFTTGYQGSAAQRNCEVHQTKVPSKGETGVKGAKFNVSQVTRHGPSDNYTANATMELPALSLEPTTLVTPPSILSTKTAFSEAHEGVALKVGSSTAAPPARLTEAQAPTHDQENVPYSAQTTATMSTIKKHIADTTTKEGVPLLTTPPELAVVTQETTVPPTAPITTVLSPGSTNEHLKAASVKEAETSTEAISELPVNTVQSSTTVLSPMIPTRATEHGPSENYTTNATTELLGISSEQTTPATTLNIPSTEAGVSEVHEGVTVTLGSSSAPPPAGLTGAQASPELALPTRETTVAPTAPSTTVLSPGSTNEHLKAASANEAEASTEANSELPVNTVQSSTTVLSPLIFTPPTAHGPSENFTANAMTESLGISLEPTTAPTPPNIPSAKAGFREAHEGVTITLSSSATAPPAGLMEAQASPELPVPTKETTAAPTAQSTTVFSPGSTDKHLKTASSKPAKSFAEITIEPPVNTAQSSTTVLSTMIPTAATENGPSENYTTNATMELLGISLEPTTTAKPPNIPSTKAGFSEVREGFTVTLGSSTAAPPAPLSTAAPPAGLTEAHAPTHGQKNVPYSVKTATTSTIKEHIADTTTKVGVPLSTTSPELAVPLRQTTVAPTAPSTTMLSPGSTDKHLKTSAKVAQAPTETTSEPPVTTKQASATLLSTIIPTPATEHGPSKNYTTNATTELLGISLEPTTTATPPNIRSTKAGFSEAFGVAVRLGSSTPAPPVPLTTTAPPAELTEAQAPAHGQKYIPYSVRATTTSKIEEHISSTTTKEGVRLSATSPELAVPARETTVAPTAPSTTVLSPGSADKHLKATIAKEAKTFTEIASVPPVNTEEYFATVLSPLKHTPEDESLRAPRRPAVLQDSFFEGNVATTNGHISSVGSETTKASHKTAIAKPIDVKVVPDTENLTKNKSGKFTAQKFATIVEALSNTGTKWFRVVSRQKPVLGEAARQVAKTTESYAYPAVSAGSVSQGAPSAAMAVPITKIETQPAAEEITNTTVSAILPEITTPSRVAQNVSTSASDNAVPIYSMLAVPVIVIANSYCCLF